MPWPPILTFRPKLLDFRLSEAERIEAMLQVYTMKDGSMAPLKGKTLAVIGYGSQGHAQAQNLRDSGVKVIVGQRKGSDNYKLAVKHGFKPVSAAEAAETADIIQILLPDEVQMKVYGEDIL